MDSITNFVKENKGVSITLIVAIAILIGIAMYMGLDLSWIPKAIYSFFNIN